MKIVITRRNVPLHVPDGINVHIFALSSELIAMGCDVYVVSDVYSKPEIVDKFFSPKYKPKIISLTNKEYLSKLSLLRIWINKGNKVLKQISPDFIIVNGAVPLTKDLMFRSCFVSHDLERRKIFGLDLMRTLYKRLMYRRAGIIVATCSELRDYLSEELSVDKARIEVIPTCFETEKYYYYPIEKRQNAILHVGTVFYKNPQLTILAFRYLNDLLADLDLKLYITGKVTRELLDFLNSIDDSVRSRIQLLGLVEAQKFLELLATVKIVSIPSTYTTPVASPTAIEALLSGTPIVCLLYTSDAADE